MYACMYICECMDVYTCMYTYIHTYIHTCTHTKITYVCVYFYILYICVYLYILYNISYVSSFQTSYGFDHLMQEKQHLALKGHFIPFSTSLLSNDMTLYATQSLSLLLKF